MPNVTAGLEDVKIIAPRSFSLECSITPGAPEAVIRWFKDAKEIYRSNKFTMSYFHGHATLSVATSDLNDGGRYRCEASNSVGRVETSAQVTVQGQWNLHF